MVAMPTSHGDVLQSVAVVKVDFLGVSSPARAEEALISLGLLLPCLQFHISQG